MHDYTEVEYITTHRLVPIDSLVGKTWMTWTLRSKDTLQMRDEGMLTFIMESKTKKNTLVLYEFIREESSSICDNKGFIHLRKDISTNSGPCFLSIRTPAGTTAGQRVDEFFRFLPMKSTSSFHFGPFT